MNEPAFRFAKLTQIVTFYNETGDIMNTRLTIETAYHA